MDVEVQLRSIYRSILEIAASKPLPPVSILILARGLLILTPPRSADGIEIPPSLFNW